MEGIILGLITMFGWAIGAIFGTVATRKIGSISVTFWAQVIGLGALTLYAPFALHDLKGYTPLLLLFNILIATLSVIGNLAYNESRRVGVPSVVNTVVSTFPAITILGSVVFFHVPLTPIHLLFIIIIFLGVIICSLDIKDFLKGSRKVEAGIFLAVIATLCWGIYGTLLKILYPSVGWFWPIYVTLCLFPFTLIYLKTKKQKLESIFNRKLFFMLFAFTVLQRIGDLSFNLAVGKGLAPIAGPFAGADPVLFSIIAYFIFKDKPNRRQTIGIVITLSGLIALSLI